MNRFCQFAHFLPYHQGAPHCHFFLRQVRLFSLACISCIILTHSVHWRKTLFDILTSAIVCITITHVSCISRWHLPASSLSGSLLKSLGEYLPSRQYYHGLSVLSIEEAVIYDDGFPVLAKLLQNRENGYWFFRSYTVKPIFKTTWEIGTTWELRAATPAPRLIQYTEMDLRNKTTSEFRTVFTVPWVSLIPRFHCS